jgi:VWFA-related protein
LFTGVSVWLARPLLVAQDAQSPASFSTDVNVVNVFATVRDKHGEIVQNLTKDDFLLQEDGRPQTIRYFSRQSDLPLTLGLLVDTSGSERRMLGTEKQASLSFLEQVLRPDRDKAFLIHFDREVELLQDLTASRARLEKALDLLDQPQWAASNQTGGNPGSGGSSGSGGGWGGQGGGHHRMHGGGGTAFFDAVYLGSHDLMASQTGRKALIMLTDGEDNASKISIDQAIDSAQRADTLAYSIRIADEEPQLTRGFAGPGMGRHGGWGGSGPYGRGPTVPHVDGKKILQQISKQTGGGYFEASKKKPVDEIYRQIEEELRNEYSIGYTPDRTATQGYRKIQLAVKQKGMIVQAREGYYPGQSKAAS